MNFLDLFDQKLIELEFSPFLEQIPSSIPGLDWGRIEGMMLGLAIGDSLGATSEGRLPEQRFEEFGEIRGYLPHWDAENREVGLPTDDTQMAFWTLEHYLEEGRLIPEKLAERFATRHIFGLGETVHQFRSNLMNRWKPWYEAGPNSAGNGALMRIAPVLIPHLQTPSARLWEECIIASMMTHNDSASTSSCVAFVAILWDLLSMDHPPEPEWWFDRYIEIARPLETKRRYRPRGGAFVEFEGSITDFVEQNVVTAHQDELSVVEACNSWYSGAFLLETVPSALYILAKHGHDAEEAIVRAVNDTKDNDTIGAIVGAAVGALHGAEKLPLRWRENLLGRTRGRDDGRVFELLEQARSRFGASLMQ